MEIRPGVVVDDSALSAFAERHGIRKLSAFGSVLRADFGPESDLDVLVEFDPDHVPGLLTIAAMELELGSLLGREVELRTYGDLSRFFRDGYAPLPGSCMPPDDAARVRHLIEAAETAVRFAKDRDRSDLDRDQMLTLALTKLVEIVGEAQAGDADNASAKSCGFVVSLVSYQARNQIWLRAVNTADLLHDVRIRSGMSVRSLARAAGVSPASVDRIEHGRVAPTATLEQILQSVGYVLELRAVPARRVPMTREDRRSLAYHRLIAIKLLDDPAAVIAKGIHNLARMRDVDVSGRSSRYLDAWDRLLMGAEHDLVGALIDTSERARDLRQVSPFAGVLTPAERLRVYPTVGAERAPRPA